jgi:hypothetical protein
MKWLGLIACGFYAVHAGYQLFFGQPENLLWICHLAPAVIGVGLLVDSPTTVTVGVLWLVPGIPLWLYDLYSGGESSPTSLFTHVGGLVVGVVALRSLGVPEQVWWKALLAAAGVQQLCRWVTPREANINLAYAVYPGWERWFPSYRMYLVALLLLFGVSFLVAEYALRRLVSS